MRTKVKLKGGISLIVLVITIIVMIILAAAIILSLSNSGIIGKANKAKTESDKANLKEYVNTLQAEWELMTETERGNQTFEQYANEKLEEKGYSKAAVGADGEVYSNLNESAKAAIVAGIKVGDTVTGYTVTSKSYTTSGDENTAPIGTERTPGIKQTITLNADTTVTWKYIGVGEDGSLEIAAEVTSSSPKMKLSGKGGYLNGPSELDKACAALYSVNGKGTAKSMNIDHVTRILGYTGEKGSYYDSENVEYTPTAEAMTIGDIVSKKGEPEFKQTQTPNGKNTWEEIKTYKVDYYKINKTNDVKEMQNAGNVGLVYGTTEYWLASSCVDANFHSGGVGFDVRCVRSAGVGADDVFISNGYSFSYTNALRPIVSLASNIQVTRDTGETAWEIK